MAASGQMQPHGIGVVDHGAIYADSYGDDQEITQNQYVVDENGNIVDPRWHQAQEMMVR